MELTGKVKWFDAKKGYGFIGAPDGGGDVFVHSADVQTKKHELEPGETVKFDLGQTPYGRRALRVRKAESGEARDG